MTEEWNINSAIEQIKDCNFECAGGNIEDNDAFLWLQATLAETLNLLFGLSRCMNIDFSKNPEIEKVFLHTLNNFNLGIEE